MNNFLKVGKKLMPLWRGLTAVFATLLAFFIIGSEVANTYRSQIDAALGTHSFEINRDEGATKYKSDYETADDFIAAIKANAVRQGEEGTVIMKNDNNALPLPSPASTKLALFGGAAYIPYQGVGAAGGLVASSQYDGVDLVKALETAGYSINTVLKEAHNTILAIQEGRNYPYRINTSIGDMTNYQIREVRPDIYESKGGAPADWKSQIPSDSIGICVFQRPGGENNTFAPGTAVNMAGNPTGKDPFALSEDELAVVDVAKETCSKVIVLVNSAGTLELGEIAKGGAHEVDAIAYIGVPNVHQFTGIVNVLTGKVNATGALPDTYVYDNTSAPAVMNFGGGYFNDYTAASVAEYGEDPRFPGQDLTNERQVSSFGRNFNMYSGGYFIVEAEGIYVGYKYYETRYYDSIVNADSSKAKSATGATQGNEWDYKNEVVYSFGHSLSYLNYEQSLYSINVDKSPEGNIRALVDVKNNSNKDGMFLAQLYVQQPYTQYDKDNLVEKSAVMFLNSKKVQVKAGQTERVEITIPTKYLASYDYKKAKTYILDDGDYYFTAAAGAHEAVNNILAAQGYKTSDGMDSAGKSNATRVWNNPAFDSATYAIDNGNVVKNVADNADLNYWLPNAVTYLSRNDWEATYPIDYNEKADGFNLKDSARFDEWVKEIRGMQYTINNNGEEAKNVNGEDNGTKFNAEQIGYEQIVNIEDPYWQNLVDNITVDNAIGAIIHGGSRTDVLKNIDNPIVIQREGPNGLNGADCTVKDSEGRDNYVNLASMTLLGSSFNPELAWDWGVLQGESGLWTDNFTDWGVGLTQRRTPYNARNLEYVSEDPMLTNRIGYGVVGGALVKGFIVGPKHMGFNDQEHTRSGISAYMTEQKMRETDLRGFQGALDDANGLAVMVAFNRIGATNASHHVGMLKNILREEWGFKGIVSTDMATNNKYFIAESMIMATVTQVADFQGDNSTIGNGERNDANWPYISLASVKNDTTLVNQARENLKYQFYAFANSAVVNISTIRVIPWWETAINSLIIVGAVLTAIMGAVWLAFSVIPAKKEEA